MIKLLLSFGSSSRDASPARSPRDARRDNNADRNARAMDRILRAAEMTEDRAD